MSVLIEARVVVWGIKLSLRRVKFNLGQGDTVKFDLCQVWLGPSLTWVKLTWVKFDLGQDWSGSSCEGSSLVWVELSCFQTNYQNDKTFYFVPILKVQPWSLNAFKER